MKRTVTVLQDDIDNGEPESYWNCAIARAANRDLADLTGGGCAGVGARLRFYASRAGNWGQGLFMSGSLAEDACAFIERFDNGQPVEPFKFEVELEKEDDLS